MSILSIRGASARPRGGDGIIAGVWPVGLTGNQTFTPDIPDAVDLIVVLANNSNANPATSMPTIYSATRCRILHGPPQPISTNAGLVGRTAVTAIGFTRPITPAVTPGTTAPGLITVTSRPSGGDSTVNLPGVEWEASVVSGAGTYTLISALALVDSPHTWEIPGEDETAGTVATTITW